MATLIKYTCAFTSIAFVTSTGKPNAAHSAIQSIAKGSEGTNAAHSNGQSAAQEASNSNVQATSIATTIATTIATAQSNAQEAVEVLEVQSLHPMLFAGFCAGNSTPNAVNRAELAIAMEAPHLIIASHLYSLVQRGLLSYSSPLYWLNPAKPEHKKLQYNFITSLMETVAQVAYVLPFAPEQLVKYPRFKYTKHTNMGALLEWLGALLDIYKHGYITDKDIADTMQAREELKQRMEEAKERMSAAQKIASIERNKKGLEALVTWACRTMEVASAAIAAEGEAPTWNERTSKLLQAIMLKKDTKLAVAKYLKRQMAELLPITGDEARQTEVMLAQINSRIIAIATEQAEVALAFGLGDSYNEAKATIAELSNTRSQESTQDLKLQIARMQDVNLRDELLKSLQGDSINKPAPMANTRVHGAALTIAVAATATLERKEEAMTKVTVELSLSMVDAKADTLRERMKAKAAIARTNAQLDAIWKAARKELLTITHEDPNALEELCTKYPLVRDKIEAEYDKLYSGEEE